MNISDLSIARVVVKTLNRLGVSHLSRSSGPSGTVCNVLRLKEYTVDTLPTGVAGMTAFVTDATAPTYLGLAVGGGAVVSPVFFNGTIWVTA